MVVLVDSSDQGRKQKFLPRSLGKMYMIEVALDFPKYLG